MLRQTGGATNNNNNQSVGFFSAESLYEKKRKVTEAEHSKEESRVESKSIVKDTKNLVQATLNCLLNPSLRGPFFWGPLYTHIPHVHAWNPLGHLSFTGQDADTFTEAAQTTANGIATFWAGPFPILYVTSNQTRLALVRESHVGIVDEVSRDYLQWLSGGNNVMCTFPAFLPIDSEIYQIQRRFLMKRFHGGAKERLPDIKKTTMSFLKQYAEEQGEHSHTLREFVMALVLHTSSHLLGLTEVTLDKHYLEQAEYRYAINNVAHYGISERVNPALEEMLYKLFLRVLKDNFNIILNATEDTNLIRNIFSSMNVAFPQVFDDFDQLPKNIRHNIAMSFSVIGLGGMVHSTANTLDWAIARLLNDQDKLDELIQLMRKYEYLDLTQEDIFDKKGQLFPVCEWVLHNVFLHPPFSHEFFLNNQPFTATLPDKSTIDVQPGNIIFVNYLQCNRSNKKMMPLENFSKSLQEESTTGKFITDKEVASFGGSITNKENRSSRVCPGARTSLYEQMIMIAILLRDYSLALTDSKQISCDIDSSKHPLCTRLDRGDVTLTKQKNASMINPNGFFSHAKTPLPACDAKNKNAAPFLETESPRSSQSLR